MAGDWIKMRTDIVDDPAVVQIAAALRISEDETVGKLHRLWAWADRHTTDGAAAGITEAWVDRFIGKRGFAAAMVLAGWLVFDAAGIHFPRFDRHNGASAKTRAEAMQRKRQSRAGRDKLPDSGHGSVTDRSHKTCDQTVTREEKREEKREEDSVPSERPATSPDPPKRDRKPPTGPHAEAIAGFKSRWEAAYPGESLPINGGKDGAAVKWMLEQVGGDVPKLLGVFDRYLADGSDFLRGHPLGTLRSQFPKYLVGAPSAARDNRPGGGVGRLGRADAEPGKYAHLDGPPRPAAAGGPQRADAEGEAGRPP